MQVRDLGKMLSIKSRSRRYNDPSADILRDCHRDGFNIGLNEGLAAGQTVNHSHVHVFPRWNADVPEPRGGIRWVIADKASYCTKNDLSVRCCAVNWALMSLRMLVFGLRFIVNLPVERLHARGGGLEESRRSQMEIFTSALTARAMRDRNIGEQWASFSTKTRAKPTRCCSVLWPTH